MWSYLEVTLIGGTYLRALHLCANISQLEEQTGKKSSWGPWKRKVKQTRNEPFKGKVQRTRNKIKICHYKRQKRGGTKAVDTIIQMPTGASCQLGPIERERGLSLISRKTAKRSRNTISACEFVFANSSTFVGELIHPSELQKNI